MTVDEDQEPPVLVINLGEKSNVGDDVDVKYEFVDPSDEIDGEFYWFGLHQRLKGQSNYVIDLKKH